jgi:hypothetical protein
MFGIFLIFGLMMILATGFASAARYENNTFYERTIMANGTVVDSTTPVTDVSSVGYVCLNSDCSQMSDQPVAGLTNNFSLTCCKIKLYNRPCLSGAPAMNTANPCDECKLQISV